MERHGHASVNSLVPALVRRQVRPKPPFRPPGRMIAATDLADGRKSCLRGFDDANGASVNRKNSACTAHSRDSVIRLLTKSVRLVRSMHDTHSLP